MLIISIRRGHLSKRRQDFLASSISPSSCCIAVSHDGPCVRSAALVFHDPTPRVALQPFKPLRGVTRFKLDAFSLREHRTAGLPISRLSPCTRQALPSL